MLSPEPRQSQPRPENTPNAFANVRIANRESQKARISHLRSQNWNRESQPEVPAHGCRSQCGKSRRRPSVATSDSRFPVGVRNWQSAIATWQLAFPGCSDGEVRFTVGRAVERERQPLLQRSGRGGDDEERGEHALQVGVPARKRLLHRAHGQSRHDACRLSRTAEPRAAGEVHPPVPILNRRDPRYPACTCNEAAIGHRHRTCECEFRAAHRR